MTAKSFDTLAAVVIVVALVWGFVSGLLADSSPIGERIVKGVVAAAICTVVFLGLRHYMCKYRTKSAEQEVPLPSTPAAVDTVDTSPAAAPGDDDEHEWVDHAEGVILGQVVFPLVGLLLLGTGVRWVFLHLGGETPSLWDYGLLALSALAIVGLARYFWPKSR